MSSSTITNTAVRTGIIVIGGQGIKPLIRNEFQSKALPPHARRGNTTGNKKQVYNQMNFRKVLN